MSAWPPPSPQHRRGDPVLERWDAGFRSVFGLLGTLVFLAAVLFLAILVFMAVMEASLGHEDIAQAFAIWSLIFGGLFYVLVRRARR